MNQEDDKVDATAFGVSRPRDNVSMKPGIVPGFGVRTSYPSVRKRRRTFDIYAYLADPVGSRTGNHAQIDVRNVT